MWYISVMPSLMHNLIYLLILFNGYLAINQTTNYRNGNSLGICIVKIDDKEYRKDIGSKWITNDSCTQHSCILTESGQPQEILVKEYCLNECKGEFELKFVPEKCCGECVKTKCKYHDEAYVIGETWKTDDNCTILQCDQHNGIPIITAFKKTCPKFDENCPANLRFTEDCCLYCKSAKKNEELFDNSNEEKEITYDEEFYKNHPCNRDCLIGAKPMICQYKFTMESYESMSKACFDCPHNLTDCFRPDCIVGDGSRRTLTVINRMMPGPTIKVCYGDTIVVDVVNHLMGESTTLHWHGIHQVHTPYMDGVPQLSQCPIQPYTSFRYNFKAKNLGTHFWHSHVGMQRGDGAFGALIITQPRILDRHDKLYDFDLFEHKMIVQDYGHISGVAMFSSHHHSIGSNKPPNILVNARGRYYPQIFLEQNKTVSISTVEPSNPSKSVPFSTTISPNNQVIYHQPKQINNMRIQERNSERTKRSIDNSIENPSKYPLEKFTVAKGYRYRFRLINAEFLNCPIAMSIDNHSLLVINSDGYDFEPVYVQSLVSYAGERFDFIVEANQPLGNYWIRFKGLMDCDERFTSAFQVGILHYEGFNNDTEPSGPPPSYKYEPDGIQLNPLNRGSGYVDSLTLTELNSLEENDDWILKQNPDYKFYIYYDFYKKDNHHFHKKNIYSFDQVPNKDNKLYMPQLNHISFKMPSELLTTGKQSNSIKFCNETSLMQRGIDCREEFCECTHVLSVKLNSVVEMILIDEGWTFDANHPFHLHGSAFKVLGLERVHSNVTVELIKQMDEMGLLKRKHEKAITKDTVTVPDGGYSIIRFKAENPGYWLFHCHIEFHAEIGMALVLKIGDDSDMPLPPKNFPTCHNFMPDINEDPDKQISDNTGTASTIRQSLMIIVMLFLVIQYTNLYF